MRKTEARAIFGNYKQMAESLGKTPTTISGWPDDLTQQQEDLVIGAAFRMGILPYEVTIKKPTED